MTNIKSWLLLVKENSARTFQTSQKDTGTKLLKKSTSDETTLCQKIEKKCGYYFCFYLGIMHAVQY